MLHLLRAILSFCRAAGGNIAISAALIFPVLLAAAALIVDEASLYHQKRRIQAGVDLAAIHAAADPANALALAHRTLVDHSILDPAIPLADLSDPAGQRLVVTPGRYEAEPTLAVHSRFVPGASPPNAVEVRFARPGTLHFARLFAPEPDIGARALASATPRAAFSIGSRLASLDAGLLNALLGQLLGTHLSLSLLDYRALAGLDVELLGFLDALAGRIGLAAGTYGEVLGANVRLSDIALALAGAAGGADPVAVALMTDLAGLVDDSISIGMARLVVADGLSGLAVGTPQAGAVAGLNALDMLMAAARLADGGRQAALALDLGLPAIAGVAVQLVAGEPPQGAWLTLGETGHVVRTAQLRLRIDISVLGNGGLGIGALAIGLPVYAELAPAEARLAALSCPAGRPDLAQLSIAVRPGVLRLLVGDVPDFHDLAAPLVASRSAIVDLAGVARVTARADIQSAQINPQIVHFTHADIANGTVRTVTTASPVSSLTASLVANLNLKLELLGTGLGASLLGGVLGTVAGLLTPVSATLDTVLVNLLETLGIGVGQADVRVHGLDCRAAVLVQ